MRMPDMERSAVSLFSGAGGLDLGLEEAGWDVLAQVEMDYDSAATLERQAKNRQKPTRVVNARVEDVRPEDLMDDLGLVRGELTLLAGGPPCQPFTTSGRRRGLLDARANTLFPAYFHWVDILRPHALLIENVDGLLSAALVHRPLNERGSRWARDAILQERKGSFLKWLVDELRARQYSVSWGVVEAADYGVPQMRQRSVLIAVLGDQPCWLPKPQFLEHSVDASFKTLREAVSGLSDLGPVMPLSDRKRRVYAMIPAGGNWRDLPDELRRETMGRAYIATGGKSGWWRRLAWDLPTPTILGMPDHSSTSLIHPDEVRCLSVNECAAAQSFPVGTEFIGRHRSQYQQVGNAVPPLLGAALGRQLAHFLAGRRDPTPPIPAWRQSSSNRRPGTHGWTANDGYHLHVPVRADHVWADAQVERLVS